MNKEQFTNEKLFGAMLAVANRLRNSQLITEDEYETLKEQLVSKYRPIFHPRSGADTSESSIEASNIIPLFTAEKRAKTP